MTMEKRLRCADVVPGCPTEIRGSSDDEVMRQAAEHARTAHGMGEIDAQTAQKVREAIRPVA
jgi:predicted small metal-binding protein